MVKFPARKVVLIQDTADRADVKASEKITIIFNQFVDACRVDADIPHDAKGAKMVQKAVRESFADFVAIGAFEESTAKNYATGAARAFFHNVPWSAGTHKDSSLAVPNPNTGKTRTSGTVKTTDAKAVIKTLAKALEQARTLKNDALAAGVLDLILEVDPTFTESAE